MDDVYKACDRFERLGVEFVKKPDDGKLIHLSLFTCHQYYVLLHVQPWYWSANSNQTMVHAKQREYQNMSKNVFLFPNPNKENA